MRLALLVGVSAALFGTHAFAQCTKDTDCKGVRICEKGACTEPRTEAPSKKPEKTETAEGVFLGVVWGDYAHWTMRATDGTKLSFFIHGSAGESTLEAPEKFVGKKCRVKWRRVTRFIPEAGGDMELDEMLSVVWL